MARVVRARRAFSQAISCFPLSTEDQLKTVKSKLLQAIRLDPGYSRAKAWLAYTLVHGHVEGYAGHTSPGVLERARRLIDEADPRHVDTKWAWAFYLLARAMDEPACFDRAVKAYESAMKRAPGNMDLMVEAAEALIYCGKLGAGERLVKRAMRRDPEDVPDWYLWDLAWIHFLRAGRASTVVARRRENLDAALAALETMLAQPDNPTFVIDALLLKAAVLWQLGRKARAKRERDRFRALKPEWSLNREARSVMFKRGDDRRHWLSTVEHVTLA